jgi:hypothetical protein
MAKATPQKKTSSDRFILDCKASLWADRPAHIISLGGVNMSDWGGENLRQDVLKVPPISQHANVNEIIGKFGGADQLLDAVSQLQSLLYAA